MPIVRIATPDDAESIGEAHAEAWLIGYDELFPPAVLEAAVDLRRRMWVGLVGDPGLGGTLLVAEEAGDVVGFIHFGPASANDEIGEIYGLYVLPSSWGCGSAQVLMDRAITSLAESFTSAILWTHTEAEGHDGSTPSLVGQRPETTVKRPPGMALPSRLSNTSEISCQVELVTTSGAIPGHGSMVELLTVRGFVSVSRGS